MRKHSRAGKIVRAALMLVPLLIGSLTIASIQQRGGSQTKVRLASTQQASLRANLRAQSPSEEAMTASQPVEMKWADVSGKISIPLKESEEKDEYIESDIDPETMRRLKAQPYRAPLSVPSSYQSTEDYSAKGGARELSPLAPNLLVNFESIDDGSQLDGFLHRPPDCAMAAGQNHVMVAINSMFAIYTKTGTLVSQASYASFFSSVCSGCSPFDPRVVYDSLAARWILLCVNGNSSTTNVSNYLIAVSQTSDPTGSWWLYSINGVLNYPGTGENTWADFPQLGFDGIASASGGAVYVTSNQFTFGASPSFRTAALNILPKSSLYAGTALNYWRASDRLNSDGTPAFTLSPALTYGNPGGEFLINTRNVGNFVSLWKVIPTYPPTAVNWTLQSTNTIGTYTIPPDATQPGGCALMATNDSRISSNAVWRNNKIYAAFTEGRDWGGGGGTVSAIRVVRINTSTNATEQNETFGTDGFHYFFPAIATDGADNEVVTFARANSSEFGSIYFTGRLTSDSAMQASTLLKSGALCITGNRWGDYFSAAIDPADNSKVWIYGVWAKDVSGVSLPWDWGTWIGQVQFATPPAGLQYYPLPAPVRLLDTRPGFQACNAPGTPLAGGTDTLQLARIACTGVPSSALAVVGNATVVNFISGGGYVTLYPSNAARPNASNLNFTANHIVPNAFTVGLGSDGGFEIFTSASTHFIVDITGYYAPPGAGGLYYHPLPAPVRLLDTRPGFQACNSPGTPLTGGTDTLQLARDACTGVPSSALAVVGNATVVNSISGGGFVTLYPSNAARPNASNLNFTANHIVPNAFTVGLGSDGGFKIFTSASTHFIVDITGYYSTEAVDANGAGLLYNPLPAPVRLLDTRPGFQACNAPGAPLVGGTDTLQLARIACTGVPASALAVVGNATVVNFISNGGFVTLYPSNAARPNASNLNFTANHIVPNAFTVGLGSDGGFKIFTSASTHFIVDITGYFGP